MIAIGYPISGFLRVANPTASFRFSQTRPSVTFEVYTHHRISADLSTKVNEFGRINLVGFHAALIPERRAARSQPALR